MTPLSEQHSTPGQFVRIHRNAAGLSLRAVAARFGKSHTWLRKVEEGVIPIPLEVTGDLLITIGMMSTDAEGKAS